jgi:beta-lactam-binding protein with PASTA domain
VVVAQDPPASGGGRDVRLLVNRGLARPLYVMPDLMGVDSATAADWLRTSGFRVTVSQVAPPGGGASGVVTRQVPESGAPLATGDAITLEVAR